MWFKHKPTVTCFYCNATLPLLPLDPKGKLPQVESRVARGTDSQFECGVCGCINERDKNGQIVSNQAAFYDSALNEESFLHRGTPTRSNFATSSSSSSRFSTPPPFCRQCLSNQSLQIHLLSSYPSYSSDEEEEEEEGDSFPPLPEYRDSLERRYPLVCQNCKAGVEEIVRERDYRVKTGILGGRLRETGKNKLDEVDETKKLQTDQRNWVVAGVIWRLRWIMWLTSHVATILIGLNSLLGRPISTMVPYLPNPLSLSMLLAAPLWTFWDPTWNAIRKEGRKKGGRARSKVEYRQLYIISQGAAFLSRIATALVLHFELLSSHILLVYLCLILIAFTALLSPFRIPRLVAPPPILLRSTDSPSRPSTPVNSSFFASSDQIEDPLEPLQNLSLSKRTSILSPPPLSPSPHSAVSSSTSLYSETLRSRLSLIKKQRAEGATKFGQPSFSSASAHGTTQTSSFPENLHSSEAAMELETSGEGEDPENSMDWTPSSQAQTAGSSTNNGSIWFKPRSFIVPDFRAPTGLEGILEKVGLSSIDEGEKMDVDGVAGGAELVENGEKGGLGWWKRWMGG